MKFRRFAAALLVVILCLSICLPAGFAVSNAVTLRLGVQVRCTGRSIPAETFQLELTAQGDEPMPEDVSRGDTVVILAANRGSEPVTVYFPEITFTRPGHYCYTVRQTGGHRADAVYDDTVYYIKVQVVNSGDGLHTDVMAFTSAEMPADEKQSEISFVNRYGSEPETPPYQPPGEITPIPPVTPVKPTEPEKPEKPEEPAESTTEEPASSTEETVVPPVEETPGRRLIQTGQLNWLAPVLTGGGAALIGIGIFLTRREKRKEENA